MKPEQQLELQAYLDGELSGHAAQRVADWMSKDAEAQALAAELRMTHGALAGNELERTLPESREFYWSKVRRAIEAAEPGEGASEPQWGWLLAWRRYLVPASSVAAALIAAAVLLFPADTTQYLAEVENLSDYVSSHSFRSRSENVFVVWISSEDRSQDEVPESFMDDGDIILQ